MTTIKDLTDKNAIKILDFFEKNFLANNETQANILNETLARQFEDIYLQAVEGAYDNWLDYKLETLALIIVLSQIPRLLYPKSSKAFETDQDAIEIAKYALNQNADHFLKNDLKIFLYLPFMQSERLEDQEVSIKKFATINKAMFKIATFHYETILNFERFPSRNIILNRESTYEEKTFLSKNNSFYFIYL
jgi:uncharacterized protein (DUF924 family)